MNQDEIKAAIAEQEEYLKRREPCMGIRFRSHQFQPHATPGPDGCIEGSDVVSRCIACGVSETPQDYRRGLASRLP